MSVRTLIVSLAWFTALAAAGTGSATIAETGAPSRAGWYDPVIDPAKFVSGVDNAYFPLEPGTVYYYEGPSNGTVERVRVAVTRKTKTILGVKCVVVLDVVAVGGKPLERTLDWYAQDRQGNVWYFGEYSLDYEHGHWVVSDGSWEAGVDGATPGIIMEARPRKGDTYRQEHYAGHAEDRARVLGYVGPRGVPYGTFENVLVTREWTPLEPGVAEKKYYARGVGSIETRAVKGESGYSKLVAVIHR